tara:strand:- start:686 stop:1279 length:594 start_codon:yes stop_codon:yes gene_type:complete
MLDNVQIATMESALEDLFEIARDSGINILHNYKWRELLQIGSLNDIGINAKAVPGVEGADFTTTKYPIGELKSARILRTKNGFLSKGITFEFDKQKDPLRRKQTLKNDCHFYSYFDGTKQVAQVLVRNKQTKARFCVLAEQKQQEFVAKWRLKEAEGKRVRDTIKFTYRDFIEMPYAEFYAYEKKITKQEFMALFGD